MEELVKDIDEDENLVLKMDCEGCEYESILKCPDSVLKRFQRICIEYHYGYQNLKARLEECGFETSMTDPTFVYASNAKNPNAFVGIITALKKRR